MKKITLVIVLLAFVVVLAACQPAEKPVAKTDNGTLTLDQIAATLPGFGVQMQEIGVRNTTMYYAAQSGNWDLVDHELEEITGAFETAMITRPKRKEPAQAFLDGAFAKLETAAKSRKLETFKTAFDSTVKACNGCHSSDDKSFIQYKLPDSISEPFDLEAR